ncbi:MAG: polyribonucleotide nucleotidyltransferase [Deltaproteobacteria bacterium]|nr:polyribonucleotide nucleotidyltransferase [Deltaproteobacteria bacterium]
MIVKETVKVGGREITIETGRIARQANGAVLVGMDETIVLVTAVTAPMARDVDFFPLTCDYVEKAYAGGKVPGGFFKREGKLRDEEILTCRLIDRPIRPMFPDGFRNETQIIATLLSADRQNKPDVLAMTGASVALHISDIPFDGPLAAIRVGRVDGAFVAYPTMEEVAKSDMDIIIEASRDAIVMVEGGGAEITESDLMDALEFGHKAVMPLLDLQDALRASIGKPKLPFAPPVRDEALFAKVKERYATAIEEAMRMTVKKERYGRMREIGSEAPKAFAEEFPGREKAVAAAIEEILRDTVRGRILAEGRRIDGRGLGDIRPITCEVGLLPRVHGSGLFTRGETQAIVTTTLGVSTDEQRLDGLYTESWKQFMLHYNFPPFATGEVKMLRGQSRREIGHGALAERALARMLPSHEKFPYTIRIVSEVTESNGSSSMASVCGGCLSLMDAGVPIKAPVAGIAMGLISDGDKVAVLSDILGDEDHLGDMDFKVTGTTAGVTAVQMDIKVKGLSRQIMEKALGQARDGRLHILGRMLDTIREPRPDLSKYAPRITTLKVRPDQIRIIIGPGGKMIKGIVEQTGVAINVEDDGTVQLASADQAAVAKAIEIIQGLTREPAAGEIFEGTVARVVDFGAFVNILPGIDGLVHISELDWNRVEKTEDICHEGDAMRVKVLEIDGSTGKIRLSRKALLEVPEGVTPRPEGDRPPRRDSRDGRSGPGGDRGGDRRGGRPQGPRGGGRGR